MLKQILSLCLVLTFAWFVPAPGQAADVVMTGAIKQVTPAVADGKSEIHLQLEGQPATFLVQMADAPRFGLCKSETVASGAEFGRLLQDLDAARGWKVKLTCIKTGSTEGPEYLVKSLERLPEK